jgi:hypothetical protein
VRANLLVKPFVANSAGIRNASSDRAADHLAIGEIVLKQREEAKPKIPSDDAQHIKADEVAKAKSRD